jgi:hypothetical protein
MGLLCEYADLYDSELYETAVRYKRLTRQQKGSRQGDLGSWGIEVLGVLLLAADDTGVACLPQTRIADSAGMSPAAVPRLPTSPSTRQACCGPRPMSNGAIRS